MDLRKRKRQIFLFLAAILIPAAVLVTLAVQVVRQDAELAAKRSADDRRTALDQLRRELTSRLQAIKLQAVNRLIDDSSSQTLSQEPIVFVAPLDQDRMVLPWERKNQPPPERLEFARYRLDGEALEFRSNDAVGAAIAYQQALTIARGALEQCESRLWLGRALSKSGKAADAESLYLAMVEQCDAVNDDEGIPFAAYAAERLSAMRSNDEVVRQYVLREATRSAWLQPAEAYLLRALIKDGPATRALSSKIRNMEQMMALAGDIHDRLGRLQFAFRSAPGDLSWIGYGDEPWLITVVSPTSFAAPVVMAVSSSGIVPPGATLRADESENSAALGEGFIDVHVTWAPERFALATGTPRGLYIAGLALIFAVTLLASYLLFRDVHREIEMAEMRSHFVASVSHELKTPLTAIRMFAETLVLGRTDGARATSEYLQTIVSESERLSRLVDNVLDFSRIEQGRKIYRMQPTSLVDVVRSAARAMQYPLSQLGFTLNISVDDSIPSINADADALEQALLNLLANAMKYSGDARTIEMRLHRAGSEALIDVVDHGLGIAREHRQRIFDKFYRVRSAETDRIAGTGLGLTLALHIVEAHQGRLEVSSEVGRGSTFSVRIPLEGPA